MNIFLSILLSLNWMNTGNEIHVNTQDSLFGELLFVTSCTRKYRYYCKYDLAQQNITT